MALAVLSTKGLSASAAVTWVPIPCAQEVTALVNTALLVLLDGKQAVREELEELGY